MLRLSSLSLLADFAPPLSILEQLAACKSSAAALVRLPFWLPPGGAGVDGRAVEFQTALGPAFGISAIPDIAANPLQPGARLPDVASECFPGGGARPGALRAGFDAVHSALGQLHAQLHALLMALLRNPAARGPALDWLGAALRTNAERAKMRPDPKKAATDGFMLNLAAVALRLCEPFLDPRSGKAWGKLDARYPSDPRARALVRRRHAPGADLGGGGRLGEWGRGRRRGRR
jgi:ubiquitin conjugation factor E4 B